MGRPNVQEWEDPLDEDEICQSSDDDSWEAKIIQCQNTKKRVGKKKTISKQERPPKRSKHSKKSTKKAPTESVHPKKKQKSDNDPSDDDDDDEYKDSDNDDEKQSEKNDDFSNLSQVSNLEDRFETLEGDDPESSDDSSSDSSDDSDDSDSTDSTDSTNSSSKKKKSKKRKRKEKKQKKKKKKKKKKDKRKSKKNKSKSNPRISVDASTLPPSSVVTINQVGTPNPIAPTIPTAITPAQPGTVQPPATFDMNEFIRLQGVENELNRKHQEKLANAQHKANMKANRTILAGLNEERSEKPKGMWKSFSKFKKNSFIRGSAKDENIEPTALNTRCKSFFDDPVAFAQGLMQDIMDHIKADGIYGHGHLTYIFKKGCLWPKKGEQIGLTIAAVLPDGEYARDLRDQVDQAEDTIQMTKKYNSSDVAVFRNKTLYGATDFEEMCMQLRTYRAIILVLFGKSSILWKE